jgi:hypothetical protein
MCYILETNLKGDQMQQVAPKDTGGPAFPISDPGLPEYDGMTLRDYFAAKAMAADITSGIHEDDFDWAAARAYKAADAMLKAREA